MADNAGEKEWKIEEICYDRKPDGGGLEFLVKWKSGDEIWQPCENVAEIEALNKHERLRGLVTRYCLRFCLPPVLPRLLLLS